MRHEHADAILAALDDGWHPGGQYRGGRCLGMAISDSAGDEQLAQQAVAEVQQQIRRQFPGRIKTDAPAGMLLFNCCNSRVIPAFNDHPETTLEDVRQVIGACCSTLVL